MKLRYHRDFNKDMRKIRDAILKKRLLAKLDEIEEAVENTESDELPEIKEMLKMEGSENAYRIKVGQTYRIGALIEEDEEEKKDEDNRFFSLKRFLHRKNIYRKFP